MFSSEFSLVLQLQNFSSSNDLQYTISMSSRIEELVIGPDKPRGLRDILLT